MDFPFQVKRSSLYAILHLFLSLFTELFIEQKQSQVKLSTIMDEEEIGRVFAQERKQKEG